MLRKKISIILLAALAAMFVLAGCGTKTEEKQEGSQEEPSAQATQAADATGTEKAPDTFKVGMECGYPPFNWTQMDASNGAVPIDGAAEYAGGYDVEISKKIADGLGKELIVVKTEWDGLIPALLSGKIDAIAAGMSPTAERKESIDFSDNYYKSDLVMVIKKDGPYANAVSIQDFSGAKITAQLNTFHYTVIDQIKGVKKQTAMDNFPTMRVALEAGSIDGYVSERPEGVSATAANSKFAMVQFTDGFETSPDDTAIAIGLQKNSELTVKINEILAGISEDDRLSIMDTAIANQPAAE